jgi:hypothetical protein
LLRAPAPSTDPAILALQALAHVAGDEAMGPRFLALTGMDGAALRASADRPETLIALMDYLMANEHDLLATAEAIGVKPEALAQAARALAGPQGSDW